MNSFKKNKDIKRIICLSFIYIPYEIDYMDSQARYAAPSAEHLFGTDNLGRDVFSRTIVAVRTSFFVAFFSVAAATLVGVILGGIMGYFGGLFDKILVRILDVIASIPSILLALVIISVIGVGKGSIFVALFIAFIPSLTRVVRGEFIREKGMDYVANARLLGASSIRIMFIHILPNILGVVLSSGIIGFNNAILAESSLSYLSLGVAPPNASLGVMLSDAQSSLINAPWCAIFPGVFLILMVLSVSLVNESAVGVNFLESKTCIKRKGTCISDAKKQGWKNVNEKNSEKTSVILSDNILEVKNLDIEFPDGKNIVKATKEVSFYVRKGEILGIVGESGSGKSVTALSIMGLLNNKARALCDEMIFDGRDLTKISGKELEAIRGNEISMVFQEPMTAFNPLKIVGEQLEEILILHGNISKDNISKDNISKDKLSKDERKKRVCKALEEVKISNPQEVYYMYPHMLSGGMCQRALIAMAMLMKPKLLIVDEPTTALDKKVALEILELLKELNKKYSTGILFISHDLFMVKQICEDVLVMENGYIVERASTQDLFENPKMEYTKKLIDSYLGNIDYRQNESEYKNNSDVIIAKDLVIGYRGKNKNKQLGEKLNLNIKSGQILGICGPSGCGKSTLAKSICGMIKPLDGELIVKDKVAMVFQNPYMSLTPWMNVRRILEEPLIINGIKNKEERKNKIILMLESVGLGEKYINRKLKHLSGGQRQRIAIALALISERKIVILDEPVSALDATVQKQITALLAKLKKEYGLTYIMISHDEMVIDTMCDDRIIL